MRRTRVKICGLRRQEDILCLNEVKPDFAGFIFDPTRHRYVDPQTAAALRGQLVPGIQAVGVFVNADPEQILRVAEVVSLDYIQLHGSEDEGFIFELKKRTTLPLIQAFRIQEPEDVRRAAASSADLILLDHGPGGTGTSFDWSLAEAIPRDFILAGGLSPDNAGKAIASCNPWALDASSSLETGEYKDPEKIKQFMKAVRQADSSYNRKQDRRQFRNE